MGAAGTARVRDTDMTQRTYREAGPAIYYVDGPIVGMDDADIAFLKDKAAVHPVRRARLCAHPDADARQHEMLIAVHRDSYIRPHRHSGKSETFMLLEGEARALVFDDEGGLTDVIEMRPQGAGKPFFYRMPEGIFHGLIIDTEWLIYFETTLGPFDPAHTSFPDWSPAPDAGADEIERFKARLAEQAAGFSARS